MTKRGKSSKAVNKVRPIENVNRNMKCFLVQNEVPLEGAIKQVCQKSLLLGKILICQNLNEELGYW